MTTYRNNYLTNVVMRVDFNTIPSIASDNAPALPEGLEDFPKSRTREGREFQLQFNETGHSVNNIFNRTWEYKSHDENKVVNIGASNISLEYLNKSYKDYNDAGSLFDKIWSAFVQKHKPQSIARIGLRYINQIDSIDGPTFDLDGWLNGEFVTAIRAGFIGEFKPMRSMHQLQLRKDEKTLLINYGMFNSEYPNPIARKEFVIDIDASIGHETQPNAVVAAMKDLSAITEEFFEHIIGDKLRAQMEPQK